MKFFEISYDFAKLWLVNWDNYQINHNTTIAKTKEVSLGAQKTLILPCSRELMKKNLDAETKAQINTEETLINKGNKLAVCWLIEL